MSVPYVPSPSTYDGSLFGPGFCRCGDHVDPHRHIEGSRSVVSFFDDEPSVTVEDQTPRIRRAHTRNRSRLVMDPLLGGKGMLAVAAILAISAIMDGGVLMLIGWWTR